MALFPQQSRGTFGSRVSRSLSKGGGGEEKCSVCGEQFTESSGRICMGGIIFHSACFKCATCHQSLLSCPYASMDDIYYCKPHYLEMVKIKSDPNRRTSTFRGNSPNSPDTQSYKSSPPHGNNSSSSSSSSSSIRETLSTGSGISSRGSGVTTPTIYTATTTTTTTTTTSTRKTILVVTCAKASNLQSNGHGATNPFVRVTYRGKSFKTQTKNSTIIPEWFELFEFNVSERDDEIKFQVCHHEDGSLPDILGQYSIKVGQIIDKIDSQINFYEQVYNIQSLNDTATTGQLCISYKFRFPLSDKDEENKQYSERFERFLEYAKFSPNDKKILSSLRIDEKRKKLRELTLLKAKEFGELFKANKKVPLSSLSDFRNCLSEKLFLKSFVAGDGNLDALLLFLVDPQIFPITTPTETKSLFPDNTSRISTIITSESRTRSPMRPGTTVPPPSDPVSNISTQGLSYEVSGRSASGGVEGRPCIFTVTFKIDGQPLPSDLTKEDLLVYIDCPGNPSPPLINLGTGCYQVGVNPKVAGQHWIDFVWRGQWCNQPFLLPIRSYKNSVPDHPYTGVERRNAAVPSSSSSVSSTIDGESSKSIPTSPTRETSRSDTQVPLTEEQPSSPSETGTNEDVESPKPLLQHQEEARLLVIEVLRDYFALNKRALNSLVHPRLISSLTTIIVYLESLSLQTVPVIRIAFYGLLSVICSATPFCENLTWDGHAVAVEALQLYQTTRKENQAYFTVVSTLKESSNCGYVLTTLVLLNYLLEASGAELRTQIRNNVLACDVFDVIQEVKKRFAQSGGVQRQIDILQKKIEFSSRASGFNEEEIDFYSVKNIAQTLLDSNEPAAGECLLNILKGLSRLSKDNPHSLRKWLNIDYLVDQLTQPDEEGSGVEAYLNFGGTLVKREEIEEAVHEKVQREEKLRTEWLTQKAELERLTKLNEEYLQTIKTLKEGTQTTPRPIEPPPKKDFSIQQTDDTKPYKGSKPSKELRPIPWKNMDSSISLDNTIFGSIDPNNPKLDTSALEMMFQKDIDSTTTTNEQSTVTGKKISLLRKPRLSEISECFQKLQKNKQILQKGLKNDNGLTNFYKVLFFGGNKDVLSVQLVELGIKCLPNSEELNNLKEWLANNPPETSHPQEQLTDVDYFQMSLLEESESIFAKLHALKFEINSEQKLQKIRNVITLLRSACETLNNSQEIVSIIEIIVAIGNFVNFDYQSRFNLSSFDIRLLSELKNIKSQQLSSNDNNTLLDYLVKLFVEQYPDLLNWTQTVAQFRPFSRISWESTEEELNKLLEDADRLQQNMNNQVFEESSKLMLNLIIKDIGEMSQFFQQTFQEWTELALKFGIVDNVSPPRFFEIFVSFSEDFCESQRIQRATAAIQKSNTEQEDKKIRELVKAVLASENQSWENMKNKTVLNKKSKLPANLIGDMVSGRKRR